MSAGSAGSRHLIDPPLTQNRLRAAPWSTAVPFLCHFPSEVSTLKRATQCAEFCPRAFIRS